MLCPPVQNLTVIVVPDMYIKRWNIVKGVGQALRNIHRHWASRLSFVSGKVEIFCQSYGPEYEAQSRGCTLRLLDWL